MSKNKDNVNKDNEVNNVLDSLSRLQLSSSCKETATTIRSTATNATRNALEEELQATHFTIFKSVTDLGFFGWRPPTTTKYRKIKNATALDIKNLLDLDGQPAALVDLAKIRQQLPLHFGSPPSQKHMNLFPFEVPHIASLHVVANYYRRHQRHDANENANNDNNDVDLLGQLDFLFGGSALEMLATCPALPDRGRNATTYVACKVPHTNAIIIKKHKVYEQDYADVGFQFERLVTGNGMADAHDTMAVEHLQVVQMREFKVLFSAEADAVDVNGNINIHGDEFDDTNNTMHDMRSSSVVEIKASNPRNWGTKTMFQMISSGSTKLCIGTKTKGILTGVAVQPLRNVAKNAVRGASHAAVLEETIMANMTAIQRGMQDYEPGQVLKIRFLKGSHPKKTLELIPVRGVDLLPSHEVIEELLACSKMLNK